MNTKTPGILTVKDFNPRIVAGIVFIIAAGLIVALLSLRSRP